MKPMPGALRHRTGADGTAVIVDEFDNGGNR